MILGAVAAQHCTVVASNSSCTDRITTVRSVLIFWKTFVCTCIWCGVAFDPSHAVAKVMLLKKDFFSSRLIISDV